MQFFNPTFIIAVLIGLSVHEAAHGYIAYKLGDPTAKMDNRISLNPLAHLDPVGTLMFFLIGFGWAKPVPIDPRFFRKPKRDSMLTALAGPAANLITAFICFLLLIAIFGTYEYSSAMGLMRTIEGGQAALIIAERILSQSIFVNLALMSFNLLPIAPLDGSKVLEGFIPYNYSREYEDFMRKGPMILLILIVAGAAFNLPILNAWVFGISSAVLNVMNLIVELI